MATKIREKKWCWKIWIVSAESLVKWSVLQAQLTREFESTRSFLVDGLAEPVSGRVVVAYEVRRDPWSVVSVSDETTAHMLRITPYQLGVVTNHGSTDFSAKWKKLITQSVTKLEKNLMQLEIRKLVSSQISETSILQFLFEIFYSECKKTVFFSVSIKILNYFIIFQILFHQCFVMSLLGSIISYKCCKLTGNWRPCFCWSP